MSNLISLLSDCKNKIATLFQMDVAGHVRIDSIVLRDSAPCKKSGARHFSFSHCSVGMQARLSSRSRCQLLQHLLLVRVAHFIYGSHCTARRPQQHCVKRSATASLRDQVTRQQKCKLLCLVVLEKGCQFLTVYSGQAVKIPLNRDHGKN